MASTNSNPISIFACQVGQVFALRRLIQQGGAKLVGVDGHRADIPEPVQNLLILMLESLQLGKAVSIVSEPDEPLTTQRAADILRVSRPFLVRPGRTRRDPFPPGWRPPPHLSARFGGLQAPAGCRPVSGCQTHGPAGGGRAHIGEGLTWLVGPTTHRLPSATVENRTSARLDPPLACRVVPRRRRQPEVAVRPWQWCRLRDVGIAPAAPGRSQSPWFGATWRRYTGLEASSQPARGMDLVKRRPRK